MAKRRGKAKARRKTNKSINLLNVAESLILANVVTEGMFNAGLKDFVFGTREGKYVVGIDGGARLTLPELLGVGKNVPVGGTYGNLKGYTNLQETLTSNFIKNGAMMATGLIFIPIGFSVVKRLTSKPRATTNRLLKNIGIKELRV